jgi:DNA polymerase-3 subunit epsilon
MSNPAKHQRQVVLDTETTGINPKEGHKIIEIGCVELINRRLTQNRFHGFSKQRKIENFLKRKKIHIKM